MSSCASDEKRSDISQGKKRNPGCFMGRCESPVAVEKHDAGPTAADSNSILFNKKSRLFMLEWE